jgi:hypothetical protein
VAVVEDMTRGILAVVELLAKVTPVVHQVAATAAAVAAVQELSEDLS